VVRGLLGRGFRILAARAVLVPLISGRGAGFLITFLPAAVPATPGSTARAVADGRGLAAQRGSPRPFEPSGGPSSPGNTAAVQYSSAMGRERPNGTVTFLFTEIEESTRRPADAATDMAAALQVHDAVVRDAIESRSGYVFARAMTVSAPCSPRPPTR